MVFCWVLFLWLLLCCGFGGVTAYLFGMLPRATERFIFVTFGYTRPRIACAAARLCSRAPWCRARGSTHHRLPVPPRSMVPRVRQSARVFACAAALHGAARAAERRVFASAAALHGAARAAERRVFACAAALHGAARAAVRIILFLCCRTPWCRACGRTPCLRLSRRAPWGRACGRTPCIRLCRRAPWCRARGSTHHRLPVPPRSMVPRVRQSARVFACATA